jgi:hypothetical protein
MVTMVNALGMHMTKVGVGLSWWEFHNRWATLCALYACGWDCITLGTFDLFPWEVSVLTCCWLRSCLPLTSCRGILLSHTHNPQPRKLAIHGLYMCTLQTPSFPSHNQQQIFSYMDNHPWHK